MSGGINTGLDIMPGVSEYRPKIKLTKTMCPIWADLESQLNQTKYTFTLLVNSLDKNS